MEWVSGIVRDEQLRLSVEVQDAAGAKRAVGVEAWKGGLKCEKEISTRVHLDLGKGRKACTREYLAALGLSHLDPAGQETYVFSHKQFQVFVPAQLLVFNTIGSNRAIRAEIFTPASLQRLATVFSSEGAIHAERSPLYGLKTGAEYSAQLERLTWLQSYPSLNAFWASIYAGALLGRLALRLPAAALEARVTAKRVRSALYVTQLTALVLDAREPPHEFAEGTACSTLVLNRTKLRKAAHLKNQIVAVEESLLSKDPIAKLSDEQWKSVQPLVADHEDSGGKGTSGFRRRHAVRDLVDILHFKFGTGLSWTEVAKRHDAYGSASHLMKRLRSDGRWESFVEALAQTRSDVPTSVPVVLNTHTLHSDGGRAG